ncbi:hypothetical protein POPTR_001G307100v4 [Populus trichocarpa]|uniref:Alkyl transferase n=1 Tax=Populus trichocarpa TaxID=3694 RepID=A0A2K2C6J1_POPTR|nr:citrate-binding protein [Populus trichocarpa]PNT57641.2 hypothetical protein POPTR_001G307100v4 [Populus trichocarpa]
MASSIVLLSLLCFSLISYQAIASRTMDPTKGFTSLPLDQSNFEVQWPYNMQEDQRYSFENGIRRMWVYSNDKPHFPTSHTRPRTEIRIQGYDYSSGVWQFEGYGYVPSGTSGVCIMQVFGATGHASTLMLRTYNGDLYYYSDKVIVKNIYDRWFRVNVIHDVDADKLHIYIDGALVYEAEGRGGESHYFKCGVYEQDDGSHYMESRWKGIKVLKKM